MASLKSLHPQLQPYAQYLLQLGRQYDRKLVVTSARRSRSKQAKLYKRWQEGKSAIPAAPPGGSLHEYGLAWDMARRGIDPLADPLLNWLGAVWGSWGGQYGGSRDPVHFQPRMSRS